MNYVALVLCLISASFSAAQQADIRVATFNIEDVRSSDLARSDQPRLLEIAEVIQRLRPNVILLNEIAYDLPGVDGIPKDAMPGTKMSFRGVRAAADIDSLIAYLQSADPS